MKKIVDLLFEKLRVWHFLVIFLISVPISGHLLRQNNLTMIELRDKVLQVDEDTGDIGKIAPHLEELRSYVLSHMNTDLGTVELPGTFNTAVEKVRKEAEANGSVSSQVYARAQEKCESPDILLSARAQCILDHVVANAEAGTDPWELQFPDKSLYSYSFVSPKWSPDFAGFSILISGMSFVILLFLVLTRGLLPLISKIIDQDPLE